MTFSQQLLAQRRVATFPDEAARLHKQLQKEYAERYGFVAFGPPAFGQVGDVQLIINAQCDVFGYLDIDLTRPLPESVSDLKAPDGRQACRLLRPRNARLDDDGR